MKRIDSIDLLRGIAVLGILIMNIQSFSMPSAAYINPSAYGDLTGINKVVWIVSHIIADTKFMSLFSLLFGAGIILLTDKLIETNRPVRKIWSSRIFWLMLFGFAHAFFLWQGDILVMYAVCGFICFFFRKRSPRFLLRLAIALFIIPILINLFQGFSWEYIPEEAVENIMMSWNPAQENNDEAMRTLISGSYAERIEYRMTEYIGMFIYYFLFTGIWRILAMMLFGMYFYKKGALSAEWEISKYKSFIYRLLPLGLIIIAAGVYYNFDKGWTAQHSMFIGINFNYVGSLLLAISYMYLVMIWSKTDLWPGVQNLLQKVGKMAFTNYILMSVICTAFFNGLGYFGNFSRLAQLLMTFVVWGIILLFTRLWMSRFKMGPLEWLWRSLTYWKWAKIK